VFQLDWRGVLIGLERYFNRIGEILQPDWGNTPTGNLVGPWGEVSLKFLGGRGEGRDWGSEKFQ
jgi:hypothetical protein